MRRWFGDWVVAIVVFLVVALPLVQPTTADWPFYRNLLLQLTGVLLLCLLLLRLDFRPHAGERLVRFLCSGINGLALAFLAWAALSTLWVAPAGAGRAFALNDLLRLGAGVLVYLVVANCVESRRQTETLLDALLIVVGFATLYRIFVPRFLPDTSPSPIGTRLLTGGFLCLLLPVVVGMAAAPLSLRRQVAGRVVLVLTVVTLLVTPTRSSWIGAVVGMGVFGVLAVRHLTEGVRHLRAHRHRLVYPVVALGAALTMLLTMSDISRRVTERVQTLPLAAQGRDPSWQDRLDRWQRTGKEIMKRPVWGLGMGNYVLRQHAFTGQGNPAAVVAREGASMDEHVHNEYLHLTAELGVPGLLLYLLMLFAFFAKSLHALERLPAGARKVLLMGCVGGIAAQSVDAVSNGAWRYTACALYFWLVLGLGVALVRSAYRVPVAAAADLPADRRPKEEVRVAV